MTDDIDHMRFVTIEYFWREMLGMESRTWFYNHLKDPGFPQRVYIGGKPMLLYDECKAYMRRRIDARQPQKKDPPGVKRRVGRPVSAPR